MLSMNLIPERIAFASTVDVAHCQDVQNYIQEKEKYDDFLRWCRGQNDYRTYPDFETAERREKFSKIFSALIP